MTSPKPSGSPTASASCAPAASSSSLRPPSWRSTPRTLMWRLCWRCGVCEPSPQPLSRPFPYPLTGRGAQDGPIPRIVAAEPSTAPSNPSLPQPLFPQGREGRKTKKKHHLAFSNSLLSLGERGAGGVRGGGASSPRFAWLWAAPILFLAALPLQAADRIVVGSKNFEESRLLGEVFAQLLEARTGLEVERRLGLAGTQVCFEALRTGAIDVYPEYTGTGLVSILGEPAKQDVTQTLNRVRSEFLSRWNLWWLSPLGFENSFEIAVPRELAEREHLSTISDLARISKRLRGGFGHEFVGREDGLIGLQKVYGLEFRTVGHLQQALQYRAARARDIDALDVYTTDGRLILYDLKVLRDDRNFFPPYEAAALVRGETLARHPEVGSVLGLLAGAFDEDAMRALNLRLQEGHESEVVVARDALRSLRLAKMERSAPAPASRKAGVLAYAWNERRDLLRRTLEHLGLSAAALLLGVLVSVPLGLWLERHRRAAEPVIRVLGLFQTVPSLALLAFM